MNKHGQGATEYLVLLGVVLLIGLIVISLLSFFPGTAKDITVTQSQIYWRGQANPIRVWETSAIETTSACLPNSYGAYLLVVENIGTDTITITAAKVDGTPRGVCPAGSLFQTDGVSLATGEKRSIYVGELGITGPVCQAGQTVEIELAFVYDTIYISGIQQTGTKKLAFTCS